MSSDSEIRSDKEQLPIRRRLLRRQALGLDWNNVNDSMVTTTVEEDVTAELVRPRMYEVYLESKEAKKIGGDVGWNGIMPLASNVNVRVGDAELASSHPKPPRERWLSEASRLNFQVMFDSIKSAILSGLELLSLYKKPAERELRARNNDRDDPALVPHIPEPPSDPNLSQELVTGVMILMPSVPRTSHRKQESRGEERLPDAVIGLKDQEWNGRIDVKDGNATHHGAKLHGVPDEYLADTPAIAKKIALASGFVDYNIFQVVDHVYFHVIPKPPASEEEGSVVGWPAKKAEPDDLKAYAEELKPEL
ncbi:hypothetical protein FRC00_007597 [Tulasnella sp. 408]|nr:hypothetical protein FRC00_007597 [Tulasnella sp. 408]